MKPLLASLALCLALLPSLSSAGVVYKWTGVGGTNPENVFLEMEFDTATVDSGAFALQLGQRDPGHTYHSGLIRFQYYGGNAGIAFGRDNFSGVGTLNMNLRFLNNGSLSGEFIINDIFTNLEMAGGNGYWQTVFTISDYPRSAQCGRQYEECDARGIIRRTDIPEPASIALLGLGALAMTRRRFRK